MYKKILTVLGIVLTCVVVVISCDERELNLNRVDVPFLFSIDQNGDKVGIINESENFVGVLSIDENYTGPRDGKQFYLETEELNGFSGELLVNGSAYSKGVALNLGNTVFKYTSSTAGTHKLVFILTNEVGRVVRDTFECNIKQFATVEYSVTATPTDWTATTVRPGTQKDFQLKITSADLTGTKPYYLSYTNLTTNGQSSIFISANSVFTSGDALPSRTVNLKLNIPQSHPDGVFELKLTVEDENGDTKDLILKYSVKAAVKPVITNGVVELTFPNGNATLGSNSLGNGKYSCLILDCYSNVSAMPHKMYKAATNLNVKVNYNDLDGTITKIRITTNNIAQEFSASGALHTQVYNIGDSYWENFKASSTTGSCVGKTNTVLPINGFAKFLKENPTCTKLCSYGCSTTAFFPHWTITAGSAIKIQVQDNEGIWSEEFVLTMPTYDALITTKPANVVY